MITAGTRLGPYEVLEAIGAGGMGEVYKGRDTRLDRSVAIKVLPPHLASNPDFKLRFEREARVISGFNHPNICTLHDVGDGFLVMEFCDGQSLAERLEKGPLPVEQVFKYGIQIADALDRAHRSGIVHRDLKPGNIMLTKSGAKLLDFGLAKPSLPVAEDEATQHKALTAEGTIVGTFQYMAPEQLEGSEADARSDIFAFGAILYEMVTGKRAFDGKTKASLIASILERQPAPISEVQPLTPPGLERLIRTAMEKDADDRWQTAHDLLLELRWLAEAGSQAGVSAPVIARRKNRERLAWTLAALATLLAVAASTVAVRVMRKPVSITRMNIVAPSSKVFDFNLDSSGSLTISPDGSRITFAAGDGGSRMLWVRPLDSLEAKPLAGTEGAIYPFWSPDSRFIAFFADGKLKKISAEGGAALTICDVELNPRSGSWNKDDVIIFAPSSVSGIHSVRAAGGKPQPVTTLDRPAGETTHRWTSFLPDQKHFLYMVGAHAAGTRSEKNAIYLGSLDGKTRKLVLHARSNPVYASGHLLYIREGVLVTHRFDPDKMELAGDPLVIAPGVRYTAAFFHGTFAVSENGTLVYALGESDPNLRLSWYSRDGKPTPIAAEPALFNEIAVSPDEARAAVSIEDPAVSTTDIWIYDLVRSSRTRFTFNAAQEFAPVWSPDGIRIVYAVFRDINNFSDLYIKPVSGGGQEQVLLKSDATKNPTSWSPEGRFIAFESFDVRRVGQKSDIWILPLDGDRKPYPFMATAFNESGAQFSPDGRWLSYLSDESGRNEIYVTSFPQPGGKWQISSGGAGGGAWSRNGREFYFASSEGVFAVAIAASSSGLEIGNPQLLFNDRNAAGGDIRSDGKRFLISHRPPEAQDAMVAVVTNWTSGLKQ